MRYSIGAVYESIVAMDRKRKVMATLCLIYWIWHFGTNWTSTLIAFIQWQTDEPLTIVDIANVQAFGAICNAFGSLAIGQVRRESDAVGAGKLQCF